MFYAKDLMGLEIPSWGERIEGLIGVAFKPYSDETIEAARTELVYRARELNIPFDRNF